MEINYYLAVFESKSHAIYVHQELKRKKLLQYELVSTPCQIKSGCSYSIKFDDPEAYSLLKEEATKIGRPVFGVYQVRRSHGRRIIQPVDLETI